MADFEKSLLTFFGGLFAVAIIAVLVSQKANTEKVLKAFAGGTAEVLGAAVSPVTGGGG